MATVPQFRKAVKRDAKGRVALIGPAGSGKSFTMLRLARLLAGPNGKIAAIDTEHGSLSKYAHTDTCGGEGVCQDPSHFDFDVLELSSFSPDNFQAGLQAAEQAGYDVFCTDSLSHFWVGKDGALEFVDNAKKRSQSRDDQSGWKDWRPHERAMVDAMIASPCHVIVTMRTKTAYEEQVNERTGKKQRVKIGLAPVQREGMEYEFDLVGSMDEENTLIVDKSRCFALGGKALSKPGERELLPFKEWLAGAPVDRSTPPPPPIRPAANVTPMRQPEQKPPFRATDDDLPPNMGGPAGDGKPSAAAKVEEARQRAAQPPQPTITRADFNALKTAYLEFGAGGGAEYDRIAQAHGTQKGDICPKTRNAATACFQALTKGLEALRQLRDEPPPEEEPQGASQDGLFNEGENR